MLPFPRWHHTFTCCDAGRSLGLEAFVSCKALFTSNWVRRLATEHFACTTAKHTHEWLPATGSAARRSPVSCCVACATQQHDAPDGHMLAQAMRSTLPQFASLRRVCRLFVARCLRMLLTLLLLKAMTCLSGGATCTAQLPPLPYLRCLTDDHLAQVAKAQEVNCELLVQ